MRFTRRISICSAAPQPPAGNSWALQPHPHSGLVRGARARAATSCRPLKVRSKHPSQPSPPSRRARAHTLRRSRWRPRGLRCSLTRRTCGGRTGDGSVAPGCARCKHRQRPSPLRSAQLRPRSRRLGRECSSGQGQTKRGRHSCSNHNSRRSQCSSNRNSNCSNSNCSSSFSSNSRSSNSYNCSSSCSSSNYNSNSNNDSSNCSNNNDSSRRNQCSRSSYPPQRARHFPPRPSLRRSSSSSSLNPSRSCSRRNSPWRACDWPRISIQFAR
mmetsp:Transcript_23135/g.58718  ORF Transcript_23135/g.58718 Transcript_23135/m.58718 type:complete len:270 (+) Transcript_23135:303-1112(+)